MPVFLIVLAVLFLLAFLRVGADGEYGEAGGSLALTFGFLRFKVYPANAKKEKKRAQKSQKEPKKGKKEAKKTGNFREILHLLPQIRKIAGKFRRKLRVKKLTIHYRAASEDPADTAMLFGAASAGAGVLTAALENLFVIKKREISTSFDFDETEPQIYVRLIATISVWQILFIGLDFIIQFLKIRKDRKEGN